MRIVIISDTHGKHKSICLPQGDILIHCGDYTNFGSMEETYPFLRWVEQQDFKHKIIIPGNHDHYTYIQEATVRADCHSRGIKFLVDQHVTVESLKIHGSPWTAAIGNLVYQYERKHDDAWWNRLQDPDIDILVTHGPPFGVGDYVPKAKKHAGCVGLLNAVRRVQPRYHVFGHIHETPGRFKADAVPTVFINATSWDHHTNTIRPPTVLEI